MSVYKYIASSNPYGAVAIINSFGYEVTDTRDLGKSLTELVAKEGEPALRKVMENHPDKDVILEMFAVNNSESKKDNVCNTCPVARKEHFFNANGGEFLEEKSQSNVLAHQTNVILLVSALFVATALIIKTK